MKKYFVLVSDLSTPSGNYAAINQNQRLKKLELIQQNRIELVSDYKNN